MEETPEPRSSAPSARPRLSREQRDRQRQIRSLVLMILGTVVLAATAIWLGQK